jgi:CTP:molybdopterin cytidylyltransferase MocA
MGAWKPALRWGSGSVIEAVVDTALAAGCRVVVIGGYRFRRLRTLLNGYPEIRVVRAWRWRRGMSFTLGRGIEEVISERFFVTPADMPHIDPSVYRALDKAFPIKSEDEPTALRPVWKGKPGHPVLISAGLIPNLLSTNRSPGGFGELLARGGWMKTLEWDDEGVVVDIDTPEEYEKRRPPNESGPPGRNAGTVKGYARSQKKGAGS